MSCNFLWGMPTDYTRDFNTRFSAQTSVRSPSLSPARFDFDVRSMFSNASLRTSTLSDRSQSLWQTYQGSRDPQFSEARFENYIVRIILFSFYFRKSQVWGLSAQEEFARHFADRSISSSLCLLFVYSCTCYLDSCAGACGIRLGARVAVRIGTDLKNITLPLHLLLPRLSLVVATGKHVECQPIESRDYSPTASHHEEVYLFVSSRRIFLVRGRRSEGRSSVNARFRIIPSRVPRGKSLATEIVL